MRHLEDLTDLTPKPDLNPDEAQQFGQFLNLLVDLEIIEPEPEPPEEIEEVLPIGLNLEQISPASAQSYLAPPPPIQPVKSSGESSLETFRQLQQLLVGAEISELNHSIEASEQKLLKLEHQIYDPTQLNELLLHRVSDVLTTKVADSREEVVAAIAPIIDQIIYARVQQDRRFMGNAISGAICPAIAQQSTTNAEELSDAIAPVVGQAMKKQINLDQDAMVDALYPIIGNTVGKYMVGVIESINEKIEQTLSVEGIKRKIQAKIQGVSEAELMIRESMPFQIQAIFLIHKASGLLIAEVQHDEQRLESDMLAGMLTAIRGFVNDCISQSGDLPLELDGIDYGTSKIILEVAGYCYLAVVVKGEPSTGFTKMMQTTLSQLVRKYDRSLHHFEGDPATIPEGVHQSLSGLRDAGTPVAAAKDNKPSPLLICGLAIAGVIAIPWGICQYLGHVQHQAEFSATAALYNAPQLSVYNLQVEAKQGELHLSGRVPNFLLSQNAERIVKAAMPKWQVKNEIVTVDVPADVVLAAAEVQRVTKVLNRLPGVAIATKYRLGEVSVEGTVGKLTDAHNVTQSLTQIPGVLSISSAVQIQPLQVDVRFYFEPDLSSLTPADRGFKLQQVINFLQQHPQQSIKIIGYSYSQTRGVDSAQIALDRANALRQALVERGIAPSRLQTHGSTDLPPGVDPTQPTWLSRCAIVDPITP